MKRYECRSPPPSLATVHFLKMLVVFVLVDYGLRKWIRTKMMEKVEPDDEGRAENIDEGARRQLSYRNRAEEIEEDGNGRD